MVTRRSSVVLLFVAFAACVLVIPGMVWATPPEAIALVTLRDSADPRLGERSIEAVGGRVLERLKPLPIYRVGLPTDAPERMLRELRADSSVRAAEYEGEQVSQITPNDALYQAYQWNLRRIGMEQAWDLRPSATDVVVAVLDTGVDLTHPDLRPNLLLDQGYDFLKDVASPQDDESHGTAVAGIIGAVGNNRLGVTGVAWHVKLLAIKALNSQGRGPDSAMVKAILYAADQGARVINISSTGARYSAALETAVQYAQDKGALVVAAAGNTGNGDNAVNYPAAFDGVLAVAAIDDKDQLASFSQRQPYVALAAPGVDVPSTARRWYFAEGSTRMPFDVSFALQNPNPAPTVAHFLFVTPEGKQTPFDMRVDASSRMTLKASDVMPNAEFASIVTTELPVYVERTMYFGHDGHSAAGARQTAKTWYLAEGSTVQPFETWVLLLNPNPVPTQVQMRFLREDGSVVEHPELVPPMGRRSIYMNALFTTAGFATQVTADQPIVVERAMYFDNGQGGHDTLATSTPGKTWYFAAGASLGGFDTWVLIENPGAAPATVKVSFMTETGTVASQPLFVLPHTRSSLYTNPLVPNAAYGMRVDSDQAIVAERAVYFDNGKSGYDSTAVAAPATEWFLPEGQTSGSFEEQLAVLNPQNQAVNVQVELRPEDGDPPPPRRFNVAATSRVTMDVNPSVQDTNVALHVTADRPIVVERVTYFARPTGLGATSSTGLTR
ncbi:MAG: DUF5719 family protein [Chloroflexi bacterium]|nr:DUF5719 family protein [Chloroflexota bacterium]